MHTLGLKRGAGYVHIFTASGSAIALLIVLAAIKGETVTALWWGLVALIIDGTDGMLARRLKVKERIPWFDGARLDDIVDYLTYAFAPMVLLWTNGYLPAGWAGTLVAIVPLMASSYQFCRVDAKTDDHFFLGFPSYWNIVAFYTIVLDLGTAEVTTILLVCSFLVFVPICYLYPSRTRTFWKANLVLTTIWHVLYAVILLQMPDPSSWAVGLSLLYLVYYLAVSLLLTVRRRQSSPAAPTPEVVAS